jgi:hypothetical protein
MFVGEFGLVLVYVELLQLKNCTRVSEKLALDSLYN